VKGRSPEGYYGEGVAGRNDLPKGAEGVISDRRSELALARLVPLPLVRV
jgi:hypothetical protein